MWCAANECSLQWGFAIEIWRETRGPASHCVQNTCETGDSWPHIWHLRVSWMEVCSDQGFDLSSMFSRAENEETCISICMPKTRKRTDRRFSVLVYKQSGPNWLNLSGFLSWMLIPVYDSLSFSNALWNDWSQWGARGLRRSPRGGYDQWYGSVMLEQSRLTDYANKISCEATIVTVPNRV